MTDYSQYEEQLHITKFFGTQIGTFLDVGAADGITFSNAYNLLLNGWSGVSVEPESQTFRALKNNYRRFGDRSEQLIAVLDTYEHFVTFYENGQLSSISQDHMDRWEQHRIENNAKWDPVTHYAITLDKVLTNYIDKQFKFISIDTEGKNLDLVRTTNWNLAEHCELICIEHDQDQESIAACMVPYGFKEYALTPVNIIMSR